MDPQQSPGMMRYAGLATQWMAMLLIAVWGGHKIDKMLNWRIPVFTILFPVVSLAVSMWQLINELNKSKK